MGVRNTKYFVSCWSVSKSETSALRHRKRSWETRDQGWSGPAVNVQWKLPKGQLRSASRSLGYFICSVVFFFNLCLADLCFALERSPSSFSCGAKGLSEILSELEVLRKPLQQADVYLPSRPLRTHCAGAWLVVMDPFNSNLQRKSWNKGLENT